MIQLTEQNKVTLAFLKEMAEQANNDLALANTLTRKGGAFGYYYINVAKLKTCTPEQFARDFPQYLSEAELLRKEYERSLLADKNDERLNTIESALQQVLAELKELREAQVTPIEPAAPAKKGKKPAPVETETIAETTEDVETEATDGDEASDETEA